MPVSITQGRVALADAVQEIEVFGLGKLLRLGDAHGEGVPGHDSFDGGERIAAKLLGADKHLAMRPYRRTMTLMALPYA